MRVFNSNIPQTLRVRLEHIRVSDEELIQMVGGRDELSLLLFDHGTLLPQSGLLLV